jgi:hypothetical protein
MRSVSPTTCGKVATGVSLQGKQRRDQRQAEQKQQRDGQRPTHIAILAYPATEGLRARDRASLQVGRSDLQTQLVTLNTCRELLEPTGKQFAVSFFRQISLH